MSRFQLLMGSLFLINSKKHFKEKFKIITFDLSEQKLEHVYPWEIQKRSFNGNFDTNENMLFASEEGKCFLVFSSSTVKSAVK